MDCVGSLMWIEHDGTTLGAELLFNARRHSTSTVVTGGKAELVGGMPIKKTETFVRRLSASAEQKKATTPRPEPVKLPQENFQPQPVESAPRKVRTAE